MPKNNVAQDVEVLRFFETSPIEVAETVFNIVRERLRERRGDGLNVPAQASAAIRQRRPRLAPAIASEPAVHPGPAQNEKV